ncbi:MAG: hypothetical protein JST31_01475 [Actinobacteria bacterium]|nr:hypothetical protein [Actinomycetota bacterium]
MRLYVDGEIVASKPLAGVDLSSEGSLHIGSAPNPGSTSYGSIDEVRLYERSLDGGEVAADMEAPLQTPRQGPVTAYSFDEGKGTVAQDVTGDGHTATLDGAEWTSHRNDCARCECPGQLYSGERNVCVRTFAAGPVLFQVFATSNPALLDFDIAWDNSGHSCPASSRSGRSVPRCDCCPNPRSRTTGSSGSRATLSPRRFKGETFHR